MTINGDQLRSSLVALLPRLRRFASALSGNKTDADDLVQTAIARALTQEGAASTADRLDSWMYKIIQNLWIDEQRRRTVRGTQEPVDVLVNAEGDDGRAVIEARSDIALVKKTFDHMKPEMRSAAVLVIVNEMTYREAADILDVPIGTVMSRVCRARQILTKNLTSASAQSEFVP